MDILLIVIGAVAAYYVVNKEKVQSTFASTPAGAEVFVNGQPKGNTPVIFKQEKGTYEVELKKELYYDTTLIINFEKNQAFTIELRQKAKIITISTKPEGSVLYLDGHNQGTTPLKLTLDFGEHKIRLVNGKHTIKKNILFSAKTPPRLNFNIILNYTETAKNLNIEMVAVQGGTFQMGSNDGDADEKPVHSVTLSNYYIGKYEITQKQWKAVMGSNPSYHKGDNLPVEQVSWNDVQKFLRKLNQITGKHYRLPTEAEWECAARGGSADLPTNYESRSVNGKFMKHIGSTSGIKPQAVGSKQANELGIYDMSGGILEWCSDGYDSNYHKNNSGKNPKGDSSVYYRVCRDGNWQNFSYAKTIRRAIIYTCRPYLRNYNLGFRLALSAP